MSSTNSTSASGGTFPLRKNEALDSIIIKTFVPRRPPLPQEQLEMLMSLAPRENVLTTADFMKRGMRFGIRKTPEKLQTVLLDCDGNVIMSTRMKNGKLLPRRPVVHGYFRMRSSCMNGLVDPDKPLNTYAKAALSHGHRYVARLYNANFVGSLPDEFTPNSRAEVEYFFKALEDLQEELYSDFVCNPTEPYMSRQLSAPNKPKSGMTAKELRARLPVDADQALFSSIIRSIYNTKEDGTSTLKSQCVNVTFSAVATGVASPIRRHNLCLPEFDRCGYFASFFKQHGDQYSPDPMVMVTPQGGVVADQCRDDMPYVGFIGLCVSDPTTKWGKINLYGAGNDIIYICDSSSYSQGTTNPKFISLLESLVSDSPSKRARQADQPCDDDELDFPDDV